LIVSSIKLVAQNEEFNNVQKLSLLRTIRTLFGINLQASGGYNSYNYKWKENSNEVVNPIYNYQNDFFNQYDLTGTIGLATPLINISHSFASRSFESTSLNAKNIQLTSVDFWGTLRYARYKYIKKNPNGDFLKYYANIDNKPWKYWLLPRYDRISFTNENSSFNRHSFLLYFISYQREHFTFNSSDLSNLNNIPNNNGRIEVSNEFVGFAAKPIFENSFANIKTLVNLGYSMNQIRNAFDSQSNDGSLGSKINKLMMYGFPMVNYEVMKFKSHVRIYDSNTTAITSDFFSGYIGRAGIFSNGLYTIGRINLHWIANFFVWGHNNNKFKNEVYELSNIKRSTTDNYLRIFLSTTF